MREVYGLLMLCSKLPSAPIRRCQKETEFCWTPLLTEALVCKNTQPLNQINTSSLILQEVE